MRNQGRHAVVLVLLLAAAGLVSCGPRSGRLEMLGIAGAAEQTVSQKTARISQDVKITGLAVEGSEVAELKGEGLVDLENRRGDLTFSVGGRDFRTLFDDGIVYQTFPGADSGFGGKKWLKLDLAKLAERAEIFRGQTSDPGLSLDFLRSLAGDVNRIGDEDVRGVATTHYRGVVHMDRAAKQVPSELRKAIEELSSQFGITTMPLDVWIDSEGRVRRIHQTIDYSKARSTPQLPAESLPGSIDLIMELYDFGAPFTFTPPAPDEVVDAMDLFGQLPGLADPDVNTPGPAPADTDDPPPAPPTPAALALVARILKAVPAGYVAQPETDSDAGPVDLDKAADNDEGDNPREALTSAGFVAGYTRTWQNDSGTGDDSFAGIIVLLYEFGSTDGARTYGIRLIRQAEDDLVKPFAVEGIPGARGLGSDDPEDPASVVVMGRGKYLAAVVVYGRESKTRDLVVSLAKQQYGLLAD